MAKGENELERLLRDLISHQDPQLLKEEYRSRIDTTKINVPKLDEYLILLMGINQAFTKIQRYPIYFAKFYPSNEESIKRAEALKHHMHAYLEDLNIFKNRTIAFLGTLKNDLKKIAINKEDVEVALDTIIKNTREVFDQVSQYRNPHNKRGMDFIDSDLVDHEMAYTMLSDENPLRDRFLPEFIDTLTRRREESFETAKENRIELSEKNCTELKGFLDHVIRNSRNLIDQFLGISSITPSLEKEVSTETPK